MHLFIEIPIPISLTYVHTHHYYDTHLPISLCCKVCNEGSVSVNVRCALSRMHFDDAKLVRHLIQNKPSIVWVHIKELWLSNFTQSAVSQL